MATCSWRCSRIHAGRPDQHGPVIELTLRQCLVGEHDLITRPEAAQPVRHHVGEVDPAAAWGDRGIDHTYAAVVAPLSDGSLTCHAPSMKRWQAVFLRSPPLAGTRFLASRYR